MNWALRREAPLFNLLLVVAVFAKRLSQTLQGISHF